MKLIKLNTDHYVVVDDSEIKEGDYYVRTDTNLIFSTLKGSNPHIIEKYCKKITHSTQPLSEKCKTCTGYCEQCVDGTKSLSLQEVKELIGEVDVEKKIRNEMGIPDYLPINSMSPPMQGSLDFGIKCYTQALEDNKEKKYTENQAKQIWKAGQEYWKTSGASITFEELTERMINQSKTEWEVEIVNGKLKLK
jgi:hypothetical protein